MSSPRQHEKPPRKARYLTTIIANNIHCSSCVSYIQEVIDRSEYSRNVISTNVSILSGEIQVLHDTQLPIKLLCRGLSDAAFEVDSATTIDEQDTLVSELTFRQNTDGLIEDAADRLRYSLHGSSRPNAIPWSLSTPLRNKRKRHVENCQACQSKDKHDILGPTLPATDTKELLDASLESGKTSFLATPASSGNLTVQKDAQIASPALLRSEKETLIGDNMASQKWSAEIGITGMTCSACTNSVHDSLTALDGVESVQIALLTNSAKVIFAGEGSCELIIKKTIEDLGYDVTHLQTTPQHRQKLSSQLEPDVAATKLERQLSSDSEFTTHKAATAAAFHARFDITGMTCSACTNSVTEMLARLPYVESATVSLMTNSAEVTMLGRENIAHVVGAVEDMGFDCSLVPDSHVVHKASAANADNEIGLPNSRSVQIKIEGFFCSKCPSRVVNGLARIYGDSIHVDRVPTVENPIITLSYIPDLANSFSIRSIVQGISTIDEQNRFRAGIYHPPSLEERSRQAQRKERRRLLWRLLASTVVVIPTFIIGVVFMSLLPADNATRKFWMAPLWSGQVPCAEWALFILATPVYFCVADVFHKRAIKEIRALWRPGSRVPIRRRLTKFGSMNLLVSAGTTVAYLASLAVLIMSATAPDPMMYHEHANAQSTKDSKGMYGMIMSKANDDSSTSTYFDMVVFLTFFILIGRYLEAYSKAKAGDAVSMLGNLRPDNALVYENNGESLTIPTDQLEVGDKLLVKYGESPAADGILLEAEACFDESSLTGESRPARKTLGEKVFTGTINVGTPVQIKVSDIGGTSMLDQIIAVVREGQVRRAPIEQIADMITGYFVPVITLLAILTFVIWVSLGYSGALDPSYMHNQQGGWAFWSLEFAIAVFVVACPCGIGLAAPTALFVGGGLAAKHGILARGGGQAFQNAGKLRAVVFDKTGTLTEGGDLKVTDLEYFGPKEHEQVVMGMVNKLETVSSHPVAAAIATAALARSDDSLCSDVIEVEEIPGSGIKGSIRTEQGVWSARIGSSRFVRAVSPEGLQDSQVQETIQTYEQQAKTVALVATCFVPNASNNPRDYDSTPAVTYQLSAIFAIEDAIRPSAAPAVAALQARGLQVYMVSGDNATTAHSVAARVGIAPENVFAGVLPTEKATTIEMLREKLQQPSTTTSSDLASHVKAQDTDIESQKKPGSQPRALIAFVGDGINDAPALSRADIAISPGNGSPIALTSSSFILMSPSLLAIPKLLEISSRVFRRVRFNFLWALVYNIVLVPVAAGVFFRTQEHGWRLGPVWGSLAMALSSVSVVVSSLLLRWE